MMFFSGKTQNVEKLPLGGGPLQGEQIALDLAIWIQGPAIWIQGYIWIQGGLGSRELQVWCRESEAMGVEVCMVRAARVLSSLCTRQRAPPLPVAPPAAFAHGSSALGGERLWVLSLESCPACTLPRPTGQCRG